MGTAKDNVELILGQAGIFLDLIWKLGVGLMRLYLVKIAAKAKKGV